MEDQLMSPLAATHLLQHTLRSLCVHESSQWVYAVFWRILPRNYPPPKWDFHGGGYDHRSRSNRRNWILVWEDGFCNFAASCRSEPAAANTSDDGVASAVDLHPELFFKLSHEIYSYGEGLIGKVASDGSYKWVFNQQLHDLQPPASETSAAAAADLQQPRTWEAQFSSGIKTIALVAVKEGVLQLGSVNKVLEDLNFVMQLRSRFSCLASIPGVFLPHPSSSPLPIEAADDRCAFQHFGEMIGSFASAAGLPQHLEPSYSSFVPEPTPPTTTTTARMFVPSMSSLDVLLSRLPSVVVPAHASVPSPSSSVSYNYHEMSAFAGDTGRRPAPAEDMVKGEMEGDEAYEHDEEMFELSGRSSSCISPYYLNVGN